MSGPDEPKKHIEENIRPWYGSELETWDTTDFNLFHLISRINHPIIVVFGPIPNVQCGSEVECQNHWHYNWDCHFFGKPC